MKKAVKTLSPINKILLSFILLILTGALLLMHPRATTNGISFVDSVFTSTSAVCVTGLVVLDTEKDFTLFGQFIILLLIQLGGLGIMTFSIGMLTLLGGDLSIKWRFTFSSFYNEVGKIPIRHLLLKIIKYTFTIEGVIAAILYTQFVQVRPPLQALWDSVFHGVSAFCNAGFSTYSQNLVPFAGNGIVLAAIGIDIILGGIGFLVLTELSNTKFKVRSFFRQYSVHTRLVIVITALLVFGGMFLFLSLEWNYALKDLGFADKLFNSFLQSVTCRTAGFNSLDIGSLRESTLFMMIFLMFTGGSPGSIAGGIKTTTMGVILLLLIVKLKGRGRIVLWDRELDDDTVDRSLVLFIWAMLFVSLASFALMVIQDIPVKNVLLAALFEVTSAFGTVGLSTGITPSLSGTNKLLLCVVMYVGRLGPLTLMTALASRVRERMIEYPQEHIMIG